MLHHNALDHIPFLLNKNTCAHFVAVLDTLRIGSAAVGSAKLPLGQFFGLFG